MEENSREAASGGGERKLPTGVVKYRVPYGDTDAMGFVYYGNYLLLFERSRNEMLRNVGYTYKELEDAGFGLPVLQSHVNYKSPAKYDDLLEIRATLVMAKGLRFRVECEVRRDDGTLIATGYTEHCCMSLATKKPARVPAELANLVPEN